MKVREFILCLLIVSSILPIFVVYWRQSMNREYEESLHTQGRTTKPLIQCRDGYFFSQINQACQPCVIGSFSFKSWIGCHSWLDCKDIEQNVRTRRLLSRPSETNAVKSIYLADWHGYPVVYMKCSHQTFWDDCRHNSHMLKGLQGSDLVTQLIGVCEEKQEVITTYHEHGSAENLNQVLERRHLNTDEQFQVRIELAKDYLRILGFLHNSPLGTRVMCDTNDLTKTLSQFLITNELHLIVNDLDALPEVNHNSGQLIKCGHRELFGWFVAPEQLWPFDDEPFNDVEMPSYDEKIDIWKIPDVIIWFLGDSVEGLKVKAKLKALFNKCKRNNPGDRPSAPEALRMFEEILIAQKVI